jgi:hypothetical protein
MLGAIVFYDTTHVDAIRGSRMGAPHVPSLHTLAVLAGGLITVQGFETIRFLGRRAHPRKSLVAAHRRSHLRGARDQRGTVARGARHQPRRPRAADARAHPPISSQHASTTARALTEGVPAAPSPLE